jgi:hypothetical protein
MFAWFVVYFLVISVLFDSFIDHCLLVAPMPFKKVPLSEVHMAMLIHNKQILIKFCLGQGLSRVDKYFLNEKTGDVGRGCLDLDELGPHPPIFIVSFMPALCPPLSCTRIATPFPRRNRNCGSITL